MDRNSIIELTPILILIITYAYIYSSPGITIINYNFTYLITISLFIISLLTSIIIILRSKFRERYASLTTLNILLILSIMYLNVNLTSIFLSSLFKKELISWIIALTPIIYSILVVKVRDFRGFLPVAFSSTYLKTIIPSIIAILMLKLLKIEGIGLIGGSSKNIPQYAVVGLVIARIIIGIIAILVLIGVVVHVVRRRGIKRGKRKNSLIESWRPIKLSRIPVYVKQSDLHTTAYVILRVEGRKQLDLSRIISILQKIRRITIFIDESGVTHIYLINDGWSLNRVVKELVTTAKILGEMLELELAYDDERIYPFEYREASHEKITYEFTFKPERRGVIHPLAPEEAVGLALVLEPGKAILNERGELTFGTRVGVWQVNREAIGLRRNEKHPTELVATTIVDDYKMFTLFLDAITRVHPMPQVRNSPLKLRRGGKHIENISLEIPLEDHIGIFGETGTGKSIAIANIVSYIVGEGRGKVLVLDWVGDFIGIEGAKVYYPGENIYIDLYGKFTKEEILEMYEEALVLSISEEERFTPAVRGIIRRIIENVDSHQKLIEALERELNLAGRQETRDLLMAAINRLQPLKPEHYSPIKNGVDIIQAIKQNKLTIIDLSELESRTDQTLYAMATLRYIMKTWSRDERLYIVIDEAVRLAPKIRWLKELILEFIARESRKYNITLILAAQRISSLKEDVIANLPTIILFNIQDKQDIEKIEPRFSSWTQTYGIHGTELKTFIAEKLQKLKPGECYLIARKYKTEPIPCYFKHKKLTRKTEKLNTKKFNDTIKQFKWPPTITENDKREAITTAKTIIRRYGRKIIDYVRKGEKFVVDGKPTLAAQIALKYYDITDGN